MFIPSPWMQLDPLTSYGLGTFAPSLQQAPAAKHLMNGDFTEGFTKRIIQHLTPQNSLTIPFKHLCPLTSAPPWYQLLLFSYHTPFLWASLQPQDRGSSPSVISATFPLDNPLYPSTPPPAISFSVLCIFTLITFQTREFHSSEDREYHK